MDAVRVVLLCVAAAVICMVLRAHRPELALCVAIVAGLTATAMVLKPLEQAVQVMNGLIAQTGMPAQTGSMMVRAAGVALIAEFGCQLCKDAGESALAGRIELCGRIVLLGMAAPVLRQLMEGIVGLMG
jgi:stage III sporulation protein AD